MMSFEQFYPHITSWVKDGCLEIGSISYHADAFICAIDQGGTAWESPDCFASLDEALAAADAGIASWYGDEMPELVEETKTPPSFTYKQGQYLAYIYNYTQIHGQSPAQADIRSFFGVTPPTVQQMVMKLEKLGLISRVAGKARSLSVLIAPETLPVLFRP